MSKHAVKAVSSKPQPSPAKPTPAPRSASPSRDTHPQSGQSRAESHDVEHDRAVLSDEASALQESEKPTGVDAPEVDTRESDATSEAAADGADEVEGADEIDASDEAADKKKQLEELRKLLEEMEKLRAEKDELMEKTPPQDFGGCCGKGHGTKKAGDGGAEDPNQVLLSDIAAVHLERAGGKIPQSGAAPQAGFAGAPGAPPPGGAAGGMNPMNATPGAPGMGGAAAPGGALGKLQSDYQRFKSQGAQIRPDIEQQVQALIGGGTVSGVGMPPPGAAIGAGASPLAATGAVRSAA